MAQQQNGPQNNQPYYQPGQAPNAGGGLTPEQRRVRQKRRQEQLDRRLSRRRTLLSILLLLIVVASFLTIRAVNGNMNQLSEVELDDMELDQDDEAEEALYKGPPVATIAFVGDISVSADQVTAATQADGTYDFTLPMSDVKSYLEDAAYAVGNFETNMVEGLAYGGEPYYNAPVELAAASAPWAFGSCPRPISMP